MKGLLQQIVLFLENLEESLADACVEFDILYGPSSDYTIGIKDEHRAVCNILEEVRNVLQNCREGS